MADEDRDAEGRGGAGDGDRLDRPRGQDRPGAGDKFWLAVLVLIVAVLFPAGLLSGMGTDTGPVNQDGYTGWH
ncbi:hypothetical protein ACFWBF_19710 [Streptomyces sp. NPDC060028]|uniref:hypothetical protein n=1 Tax=Streptomyces sp. NPDC060028 TaxID=3347041 RepID=UPI0036A5DF1C